MSGDRGNVNSRKLIHGICFALIFSPAPFPAAVEDFTHAIHAFLQRRIEVARRDGGIVVGFVDDPVDLRAFAFDLGWLK